MIKFYGNLVYFSKISVQAYSELVNTNLGNKTTLTMNLTQQKVTLELTEINDINNSPVNSSILFIFKTSRLVLFKKKRIWIIKSIIIQQYVHVLKLDMIMLFQFHLSSISGHNEIEHIIEQMKRCSDLWWWWNSFTNRNRNS